MHTQTANKVQSEGLTSEPPLVPSATYNNTTNNNNHTTTINNHNNNNHNNNNNSPSAARNSQGLGHFLLTGPANADRALRNSPCTEGEPEKGNPTTKSPEHHISFTFKCHRHKVTCFSHHPFVDTPLGRASSRPRAPQAFHGPIHPVHHEDDVGAWAPGAPFGCQ